MESMNRVVIFSWVVVNGTRDYSKYSELILLPHQYKYRIIVKLEISLGKHVEVQVVLDIYIMGIDTGDSVPKGYQKLIQSYHTLYDDVWVADTVHDVDYDRYTGVD